ncbi:NADPH:quinone oxidoreductase family protein [Salinarimonas rosea]|uniref:NADPH:quinone oxidoreductase family protein n=1 Tax=Salinarimonas rosea TaxID=552063 RepID=UPI00048F8A16|nr:NADPH:quinone oxidoreductase family protein [Salinarimonas rosea]
MRAILCERLGPPETLALAEIPVPEPGPGEVLLRMRAVGLNFFDTLIVQGRYQVRPDLPFSPGGELCGEVAALGAGVEGWELGRRVVAYVGHGAAREWVVAPADRLTPVPAGLDDVRAAGLSITYGTTLHALADRAAIRPGETLAVLGAAGGTGLAAVEVGKALGARVIACASSADKLALARAAGADETVDYAREDLKTHLKALTGGRGVDVVYDPVGGDLAEAALRATAWEGRYLVIGFAAGEIPKIPLNLVLLKGCDIRGVYWGAFLEREPARHARNMERLLAWAADGTLAARVEATYALAQAAEAIGRIARREARGKLVLVP